MCMGDIDRIDGTDFLRIESDLDRTFHEISDSEVREPCIDEDADIFALRIFYIDEKLGMSEWCDNHAKMEKIPKITLG